MPELPEVETIRRGLEGRLVGRTITDFEVRLAKQFQSDPKLIPRHIIGARVVRLWRRAKLLGLELSSGYTLLIHLKMTGQLIWQDGSGRRFAGGHPIPFVEGDLPSKTTHIVFSFDDGSQLYFNDLRQFGYAKLEETSELVNHPFLKSLSPEPLSDHWRLEDLSAKLKRRPKIRIKLALLDQRVAAGIGNIYADEALFVARIHPERPAVSLDDDEIQRLHSAVREVLREALRRGGTSIQAYIDPDGQRGTYGAHAWVYRRAGEPCRECGTPIERIILGGRGSHFCPLCQRTAG